MTSLHDKIRMLQYEAFLDGAGIHIGFDDTELAEVVTPGLTTVRQPLAEMGRMAVSLLGRALENHRFEPVHVELATRLVVRSSTQRLDP